MAKTAASDALSKTLKSRKAKAAARGSRAQTASKSAAPTPALDGERASAANHGSAAAALELSTEEVLRAFDLELKYGPCAGLTRLERFERAKQLGFAPPERICALLVDELQAADQISVFGQL